LSFLLGDRWTHVDIPTWEEGVWTTTPFATREEFKEFALTIFKEPGQYEFDESSFVFNEQARAFRRQGFFCNYPMKSRDYVTYWDDQKAKCRFGVIFKNRGKIWYLPRDYYMWINFLPINDKEQKKFDFPQVRDAQYHMALYEILCELFYKHAAILKKRQIASSYFHCAKLINTIWFEETPILKMGASLKDYINDKGTWKFLSEYRSFLDQHTAWYRPMNPGKVLMWQQQIEETIQGRKHMKGNKGVLQGVTFEKDPTAGVGGACTYFFYEEGGIAPTMDITVEFLFPALRSGQITTGLFIAAGSVGDLDQCEPLKSMILHPQSNDIYGVPTDLLDDKGNRGVTGLFIPEQWSMPPFIDEYGNSMVKEALESIATERINWKKDLSAEKYQYRISQHPINIAEAFAYRKLSKFPQNLVSSQMARIQDKNYPYEHVELIRLQDGKIEIKPTSKLPISEFPITKDTEDKTGCIVMYERPVKEPEFGMYYASVDPVAEGKTTTSDSLCSIYVYKNPVEVTRVNGQETETFIEQDKIVAAWCGRFDDINETHERMELLIELYNAWTIVENNVSLFIRHMMDKKKQRYLVPKNQIVFLKDLGANTNVYQEYGWRNTGVLFRNHLLSYLIEFLQEKIDTETKEDGTIVKVTYGIERIPDIMAMEEMRAYTDDLNVDRLVALSALVAFAKVQQANRGFKKRVETLSPNNLQNPKNLYKLDKNPFRHIGHSSPGQGQYRIKRSAYKNLK
jgi:hypothetical protein